MPNTTTARILVLSGVQGDTRRYRAFHLWQQLQLAGVECALSHVTFPSLFEQASRANVVILQRVPMDHYIEGLLKEMRRHEAFVIYDTDDLLFDPSAFEWINSPDFVDPIRVRLYQEEMRRQKLTLESSDAALVSTEYLADRVKALGKAAWIYRNAFSLEMEFLADKTERQRAHSSDKLVIGYASGTPTHDRDLALISPALTQILCNHAEAELWLVGPIQPVENWPAKSSQLHRIPFLPWRELPSLLVQFDINLAPLMSDNPFSLSKSEIKYLEAGLVSVPTVASRTPAFEFAIRHGDNGFLVRNEGEWLSVLERLIESPEMRQQVGQQAQTQVLEQYSPIRRSQEIVATLNRIYSNERGKPLWDLEQVTWMEAEREKRLIRSEGFWVSEKQEHQPSMAQRAVYQLRHRSLTSLAGYVWIYFRRWLAFIFPF